MAFTDSPKEFTDRSEEVTFGGSNTTGNSGSTGSTTGSNAPNPNVGKPRAIVSMGDSFISGEGGRWYGNALSPSKAGTDRGRQSYVDGTDANNCHRSDVAEVHSAQIPGLVPINLACSGAIADEVISESKNGEAPQVEQLVEKAQTYDIEVIVLSIGGNDLGFGDILAGCIGNYVADSGSCEDSGIDDKIVYDVDPKVRASIKKIREEMDLAGDSDYRLILQSYPSPVPRSSETRYSGDDRVEGGCAFYDEDLDWARDTIVPAIDSQYRKIADEMGIEFMSMSNALQGKEVCSTTTERASTSNLATNSGQADRMEWVRIGNPAIAISQGEPAEMFHPNALAQVSFGKCLATAYRSSSRVHQCEQ